MITLTDICEAFAVKYYSDYLQKNIYLYTIYNTIKGARSAISRYNLKNARVIRLTFDKYIEDNETDLKRKD